MKKLNINGNDIEFDADDDTPLLWVLRDTLAMTGTKFGCGVMQCGACTVMVDGQATRTCMMPVSNFTPDQKIVTIEGLSNDATHPIQKAWLDNDVAQCGYCQSGMIMAATSLLENNANPSDQDIDKAMQNICRCGTYQKIKVAIKQAAKTISSASTMEESSNA